jgi:hypothetical protein
VNKHDVILWANGNFSVRRGNKYERPWVTYLVADKKVFGTFSDQNITASLRFFEGTTYIEAPSA